MEQEEKQKKIDKLKKVLEKAVKFEGNSNLAIANEFVGVEENINNVGSKVDILSEEIKKKISELETESVYEVDEEKIAENVLSKVKIPDPIPGKDGKDGKSIKGENGKDAVVDYEYIISKIPEPVEGKMGLPGANGSPDTPDQVTDKVNLGKPLIKKERVEGLTDLERITKENAHKIYTGISETRALELIKTTNSTNGTLGSSFESISKNLKSYPYTFNKTGDVLDSITYTLPSGTITKTFNRTGTVLNTVVLSGDTPSGIDLTKTFNYTGSVLTSISYS